MMKMLGQVSDCSPKVAVVTAGLKEEINLTSVRFYNGSGGAAVVTVYVSEDGVSSGTANIIYYNAALANNAVVELTGLRLGNGQKLEVLTDVASNLIVTAFGEKSTSYA